MGAKPTEQPIPSGQMEGTTKVNIEMSKKTPNMRFVFRLYNTTALAAGVTTVSLIPGNFVGSTRMVAAVDGYAFFRIRRLRFRLHRTADTNLQVAGYIPGNPNTLPSTVTQMGELMYGTTLVPSYTQPSQWVSVGKRELAGPLPWYKTVPGTDPLDFEAPGSIQILGTSTGAVLFEMEGEYEFKEALSTGNTPAIAELVRRERALRRQEVENATRAKLLRALSTPGAGEPSTGGV